MTDTTETPATEPAAAPAPRQRAKAEPMFIATLKRGANYAVRHNGKIFRFKGGVDSPPIPASLKERLEGTAKDGVTVTDGDAFATTELRQKFHFRNA